MTKSDITKIFRNPPILDTERLILRKIVKSDYPDMYEYSKRAEVTKYLLWSPHRDEEYTRRYVSYLQTRYLMGSFYDWGLELKSNGKMIGTCGFTSFNFESNSAEIGYVLNNEYWDQGLATEAVARVIRFGFRRLDLNRIEARYMTGNEKSRKVMEKNGMTFEGIARESMFVKGKYVSIGVCSILREEFDKIANQGRLPVKT